MSRAEVCDYLALIGDIADIVAEANFMTDEDSNLQKTHGYLSDIIYSY